MARPKKTLTEQLLNEIDKRGSMTPKEARTFVLQKSASIGKKSAVEQLTYFASGYYDAQFFGTRDRAGLVGRYLKFNGEEFTRTAKPANKGPYYPFRKNAVRRESARHVAGKTPAFANPGEYSYTW